MRASYQVLVLLLLTALAVAGAKYFHPRAPDAHSVNEPEPRDDEDAALQSGLTLDQDPLELKPKPEDEEIEATFTFTNTGKKALTVTGLESSCSCLEASLDKAVYQPGEKGTGKAKFKVSSFTGQNEKFLHIYTDNPKSKDVVLTAVIDVPELVLVEPKMLEWVIGDKPEPKQYTVKMVGKEEFHIKSVTSTRESVKAAFAEIKPGREYQITVTPTTTAEIVVGAVWIDTDSKIPKYQRQPTYYNIMTAEQFERRRKLEMEEKNGQTMKVPYQVLVLLSLTALAAAGTKYFHPRAPEWYAVSEPMHDEDVTLDAVAQRWHNEVLWVDARPHDQYAASHMPGALLINEQERDSLLADHMEELSASRMPIVIYCSSDSCEASRKMRQYILERVPLEQIYVLRGGWKELEKHPELIKGRLRSSAALPDG